MKSIGIVGSAAGINTKQPARPFPFRRKRGASLVEMLIAIIVLAVVLISMLGMFVISRTAVFSKEDETAVALALRYMEDLEGLDFPDFETWQQSPQRLSNPTNPKYEITATYVESESDAYRAKIRVEVKWRGAALGERIVEFERVVSAVGYKNVGEKGE